MQKRQEPKKGKITIEGVIPPIQSAFKFLDGGGARITIDLTPESSTKYFQFIQLANRQNLVVTAEMGLRSADATPEKTLKVIYPNV